LEVDVKMVKISISTLLLMLTTAVSAGAQTIAGAWQGTLALGGAELRLVLHLTPDGKSGFTATLDSPDQGALGIPASTATLAASSVKVDFPQIQGSYQGTVNAGMTAITGSWSQAGMSAPLNLSRAPAASTVKRVPKPSDIDGDWEGSLDAGGMSLRLVFHVATFEDGMSATMDSLDQGASGIPVTSVTRKGTKLDFEMKQLAGGFSGTIDAGLATIDGTWTQAGNNLPLALKRVRR
jgi:hypothetical protein